MEPKDTIPKEDANKNQMRGKLKPITKEQEIKEPKEEPKVDDNIIDPDKGDERIDREFETRF